MEHGLQSRSEPTLIFDTFDIDLVVKVLSHTVFSESRGSSSTFEYSDAGISGPFFLFFQPVFFFFHGSRLTDIPVVISSVYWALVSLFCASSPSTRHLGQTFLSRVFEMVFEVVSQSRQFALWAGPT
jgi:hypothetical protein